MYKAVLRNELLGTRIDGLHQNGASNGGGLFSSGGSGGPVAGSHNASPAGAGMNLSIVTTGPAGANNMPTAQTGNLIGANGANMQATGGANVKSIHLFSHPSFYFKTHLFISRLTQSIHLYLHFFSHFITGLFN